MARHYFSAAKYLPVFFIKKYIHIVNFLKNWIFFCYKYIKEKNTSDTCMREVVVTRTELNEKLTIDSGSYLENLNFYDILHVLYTMCQNICGLMLALLWLNSKSD